MNKLTTSYEQDFYAWTRHNAQLLREVIVGWVEERNPTPVSEISLVRLGFASLTQPIYTSNYEYLVFVAQIGHVGL